MSTRENFAKVLLEPIAVISIHLRGWPVYETPASVAYESLVSWLKGNVVLIEIDFDFTTSTTKKNFTARLNKLLGEFRSGGPLEKCVFSMLSFKCSPTHQRLVNRFTRFSIYLSTHSDPFSGDLHIGPTPSCGASPIDEVVSHVEIYFVFADKCYRSLIFCFHQHFKPFFVVTLEIC